MDKGNVDVSALLEVIFTAGDKQVSVVSDSILAGTSMLPNLQVKLNDGKK
jgi:hypothetical protein